MLEGKISLKYEKESKLKVEIPKLKNIYKMNAKSNSCHF